MRKSGLREFQFDLSVECPHCHAKLQPAEQHRLSMDGTMLCPRCGKTFNEGESRDAVPKQVLR